MIDPIPYYRKLGLPGGADLQQVKRAYRNKARQYHPDLNSSPGAADKFIEATEAYEFLLNMFEHLNESPQTTGEFYDEWKRFRQQQARNRAQSYARSGYSQFRNSDLYRTSAILDRTRLYINLAFSLLIVFAAIYGYIWRIKMVSEGYEKPSLISFIFLLSVGLVFLGITLVYLIAYYQIQNKRRNEKKDTKPV